MFADTIISDANIHTLDRHHPRADALAISGGRIIAVGTNDQISQYRGAQTSVIDGTGKTITPGLIDAHLHPIQGADITVGRDLAGVTSLAELRAALRAEADRVAQRDPNGWVRAWNLDYAAFENAPLHASTIEDTVRGLPTLILLFDVHTAVASAQAMSIAGITGARNFDDTSEIMVDDRGNPTGELREESAFNLILDITPRLTAEETQERSRQVLLDLRRSGVTGGVLMDGNQASIDLLQALDASEGGLPIRLQSALIHNPGFSEEQTQHIISQRDTRGSLWHGGLIKLFADGVIDSGTGWLYEPDTHGEGLASFWSDPDEFTRTVNRYARAGFQIATHAIGDRAIGETINAYIEAGVRSHGGAAHRVEHVEYMNDADLTRLIDNGITASMQPIHMQWRAADGSDSWAERLGAERAARAWRTGDIVRWGGLLALGSDWPVAELDVRAGMAWARLRRAPGEPDAHIFEPEQVLSPLEALAGYTLWAAQAQGDHDLGKVVPGFRADLTVWDEDPLAVTGDELVDVPIADTFVDGDSMNKNEKG